MIDLRSDTVTLPTEEMLDAMRFAKVGDDILGEDPTVKELEEYAANLLGKEAAVFTVSGTMSNQIAVMALCDRGDEVILGSESHMYNMEVAGLAALSQVQARAISCPKGYYNPQLIERAIQDRSVQHAKTGLICIENTYNMNRGYPVSKQNINDVVSLAHSRGVSVYIDGARIFNAASVLGTDVKDLVRSVDVLQICLTKGMCAPFGSLLLGSNNFVDHARWLKQRVGGGMRQAGYSAAAALVALKTMIPQIEKDNARAKKLLSHILAELPGLFDESETVTNIITIDVSKNCKDALAFYKQMLNAGVHVKKVGESEFRMVCHRGVSDSDIEIIVSALKNAVN